MATKPQHKHLQPHNRAGDALTTDGLKLHQRVLHLPQRGKRFPLTLLTLRPGTQAAWSTNFFHNTHHLISDQPGARLLARLLWGLAFCQTSGVCIALYGEHLRPTPFDADPSLPILLLSAHLTPIDAGIFRALKARLSRLSPPEKTVRWRTFGLDAFLAAEAESMEQHDDLWRPEGKPHWSREKMVVCGGFLCYSAPPAVLRYQARMLHQLHVYGNDSDWKQQPTDYHYLAAGRPFRGGFPDGEVQIFSDHHKQISDARVARREVQDNEPTLSDPETLRERVRVPCRNVAARRNKRPLALTGV